MLISSYQRYVLNLFRLNYRKRYYGYGRHLLFKYRSFPAFSEQECENWIRGLRYMTNDTISSSYPLEMERWLRKEFYQMESTRETYGSN